MPSASAGSGLAASSGKQGGARARGLLAGDSRLTARRGSLAGHSPEEAWAGCCWRKGGARGLDVAWRCKVSLAVAAWAEEILVLS